MKKISLLIIISFLFGCVFSIKTNHHKLHRSSGKRPSWATEVTSPIVEVNGEKYFLVTAQGKNLEYLKRVSLDARATEKVLDFYNTNSLKHQGFGIEYSYWEMYETQQNGIYEYSYKIWALYSVPKLSP